jgi:uncharacterized protein (TIGR03382 family)
MRTALLLFATLAAGGALAEPDTFGLGTGRNGFLRLDPPQDVVLNRYGALTASVAAGSRDVVISHAQLFSAGDLVLLHQTAGLVPVPASGDVRSLNLNSSAVGRFEYARVESVSATGLRLTAPLLYGYTAQEAQVVSVPEYSELEVRSGATLRAMPWDGSRGGILAVMVSGRLRNDGLITVEGAGFRGGVFLNHADLNYCSGLDEPEATGGAAKGESLVTGRFGAASGRGNLANGGGGGNCHNAGGGGGSHLGAGGQGGRSAPADEEREAGGLGGAPLVYLPQERLVFGGGGGAGEGNNNDGTSGGAGGGLMLLRALEVRGPGVYRANGATPPPTPGDDGAGGGGAGGAISLRALEEIECGTIQAQGGAGGNVTESAFPLGPGGGGGGGVVFLQGETFACGTSVVAGAPGQSAATNTPHGAGPGDVTGGPAYGSEQRVQQPFRLPTTPTVTQPANGATGLSPRPRIAGTAQRDVRVHLFLDGVPLAMVLASGTGAFAYNVSADLPPGQHELRASAEVLGVRSQASSPHVFGIAGEIPDAGTPDAGVPDSGTPGPGTPDSGTPDSGTPDGGDGEPQPDGGSQGPGDAAPAPVVVVPTEGEVVGPMPLLAGTARGAQQVSLKVDGSEVARVEVDAQGRFRYTLTAAQALELGAHRVNAYTYDSAGAVLAVSPATSFEVASVAGDVGCGCGASPGAGFGAVALLLGAWAARRRRVR